MRPVRRIGLAEATGGDRSKGRRECIAVVLAEDLSYAVRRAQSGLHGVDGDAVGGHLAGKRQRNAVAPERAVFGNTTWG